MVLQSVDISKFYQFYEFKNDLKKYSFCTLRKLKVLKGKSSLESFLAIMFTKYHSFLSQRNIFLVLFVLLGSPGSSAHKESACKAGSSIPGLGRSAGEGIGCHCSILAWRIL